MPLVQITTVPNRSKPDSFSADTDSFFSEFDQAVDQINSLINSYSLSVNSTSATSLTIGTGTKTLTVDTDAGYLEGMGVNIASTASPANNMLGTVTSYNSSTGALEVSVSSVNGSGTFSAWSVSLAIIANFDGQTFTDLVLAGMITEEWYTLSGTDIDPANGVNQHKTLTDSTTFTESLANGQHVFLEISPAGNSIVWPTITWTNNDGTAPDWSGATTGWAVLWKRGDTLYGIETTQVAP